MAFGVILDGFRDWRSRKIADARFRRWATRLVLTRPTARRSAARLFDLTAGFVYSQILRAFLESGACDLLATRSRSLTEIAWHCGLSAERAARLLKAAAALELAEETRDGRYRLGPSGAALVGNDGLRAMILHHEVLYRDLADPLDLLSSDRPTELSRFWDYGEEREGAAAYSRLMSASQAFVAEEVLAAWPFRRHRRLLDVGGGDGTFLRAAHRNAPHLELSLFDLPAVAQIARRRFADDGIAASVHSGSFLDDPLPQGADLMTFNRVLHDHGDDAVRVILRRAHEALAPGATLLVNEPMAGAGTRRMSDAYFGFYFLAMRQGEPRSAERLSTLLTQAGFRKPRLVPTAMPLLAGMIAATR